MKANDSQITWGGKGEVALGREGWGGLGWDGWGRPGVGGVKVPRVGGVSAHVGTCCAHIYNEASMVKQSHLPSSADDVIGRFRWHHQQKSPCEPLQGTLIQVENPIFLPINIQYFSKKIYHVVGQLIRIPYIPILSNSVNFNFRTPLMPPAPTPTASPQPPPLPKRSPYDSLLFLWN